MINTAAFESLQRYELLEDAMLKVKYLMHPYHWMHEALFDSLIRERDFMLSNKENWKAQVYPPPEVKP